MLLRRTSDELTVDEGAWSGASCRTVRKSSSGRQAELLAAQQLAEFSKRSDVDHVIRRQPGPPRPVDARSAYTGTHLTECASVEIASSTSASFAA